MYAAVRALQELDPAALQLLSKQVCKKHWFPKGISGGKKKKEIRRNEKKIEREKHKTTSTNKKINKQTNIKKS